MSIKEVDRDTSVKRIIELCKEKNYRKETLFLAINIFDRVVSQTYVFLKKEQLPLLYATSVLLAAKME